jgi:hypothetical protein
MGTNQAASARCRPSLRTYTKEETTRILSDYMLPVRGNGEGLEATEDEERASPISYQRFSDKPLLSMLLTPTNRWLSRKQMSVQLTFAVLWPLTTPLLPDRHRNLQLTLT